VDLGLTLDLKPKETPQAALKRCVGEIAKFVKSGDTRKKVAMLDQVIEDQI